MLEALASRLEAIASRLEAIGLKGDLRKLYGSFLKTSLRKLYGFLRKLMFGNSEESKSNIKPARNSFCT